MLALGFSAVNALMAGLVYGAAGFVAEQIPFQTEADRKTGSPEMPWLNA